jgi:hypothetical protein
MLQAGAARQGHGPLAIEIGHQDIQAKLLTTLKFLSSEPFGWKKRFYGNVR